MSEAFQSLAPAKVNLGLRITALRPNGYHELDSVFAPLDLADEVELSVTEAPAARAALSLEADDGGATPGGDDNLATRAAVSFLEASGLSLSVEIRLRKWIPVGAGMGGGSSDAAAVLRLLSQACPGAVPAPRLAELALSLGADVPYFLDARPARVTGIGERIAPLPGLPALPLLLANPGRVLATDLVYRTYDALVPDPAAVVPEVRRPLPLPGGAELALDNDLEAAALRLCPELRRLRERLEALGPRAVGMSGSGPTLFAVFASPNEARQAAAADLGPGVWSRVASTRESR